MGIVLGVTDSTSFHNIRSVSGRLWSAAMTRSFLEKYLLVSFVRGEMLVKHLTQKTLIMLNGLLWVFLCNFTWWLLYGKRTQTAPDL